MFVTVLNFNASEIFLFEPKGRGDGSGGGGRVRSLGLFYFLIPLRIPV